MYRSIFKAIFSGIFFGAVMFLMPFFILKVIAFFMITGFIFRMFMWRRFGRHAQNHRLAFVERVRSMSDEDYNRFKSDFSQGCGHGCGHSYQQNNNSTHETQK